MTINSGTTLNRMLKGVVFSPEDTQLTEFLQLERTIQNELSQQESISSGTCSAKPPLGLPPIAVNSNLPSKKALPPSSIRLQSPSMNDLGDSF